MGRPSEPIARSNAEIKPCEYNIIDEIKTQHTYFLKRISELETETKAKAEAKAHSNSE